MKIAEEGPRLTFRRDGAQLLRGTKPIFLWRSFGTAPGLPQCMGQPGDFIVSEGCEAVSSHRLSHLVRPLGVLERFPGMLVSRLVFRLSLLLAGAVGVGGDVVQFRGPLMIFVMRAAIVARRHGQRVTICPDFAWTSLANL